MARSKKEKIVLKDEDSYVESAVVEKEDCSVNKKNIISVVFQVTGTKITFCYGMKAYNRYFKENFTVDNKIEWGGCSTEVTNKDKYEIVIGVRKYKDVYALKGLIVHELSHAVSQLMEYFNFNCDELRSYTLQYLYQEIIPFVDQRISKK